MHLKRKYISGTLILVGLTAVAAAYDYDANDFAVEVVSYIEGAGVGFDVINLEPYNQPETALGRPTLETRRYGYRSKHYNGGGAGVPCVAVI